MTWHRGLVTAILVFFCILAFAGANTILPQPDEAVYANPGYNITYNGFPGTTLYELRGYMPLSMAQRTYWQFPLYFFSTAFWFRMAGFGVFQVRLYSLLFALMSLGSWYWIVRRLTGSASAGLLALGLIATDFFFFLGASTGRMDMQCCGLGSAGLAAYLLLRERSLAQAVFWSHVLATLSIISHGVGVLYWLALVYLILTKDRRDLSVRVALCGLAPALAGMGLWSLYILQDLAGFREQMRASVQILSGYWDTTGLSQNSLIRSLQLEWRYRYQGPFGLAAGVGLAQRLKAVILVAYVVPIIGLVISRWYRRSAGLIALSVMTLIAVLYLGLVSPSKFYYYLPHATVFMAASLGAFLAALAYSAPRNRWVAGAAVVVVTGLQLAGIFYRIHQDPYHHSYLPVVRMALDHTAKNSIIMAPGEIWFAVQHDRYMIYDPILGLLSGMVPDLVVWSKTERELQQKHKVSDPATFLYVQRILEGRKLIYEDENYQVYAR